MPEHAESECPRCGEEFVCKLGSYFLCDCSDIQLSREQAAYLSEYWEECLCCKCLLEIIENWDDIAELAETLGAESLYNSQALDSQKQDSDAQDR